MQRLLLLLAMPVGPILYVLDLTGVTPALGHVGTLRVLPSDVVWLGLLAGYGGLLARGAVHFRFGHLEAALFAFLGALGLAAFLAELRSPSYALMDGLAGVLRMVQQATLVVIVSGLAISPDDRRFVVRMTAVFGVFCVANVLLSFGLGRMGIVFGESQHLVPDLGGPQRAFGLLGDVVSFLLVLFAAWAMAIGRMWAVVLSIVAVVLTGTRGALVVLVVAAAGLLLQPDVRETVRRRRVRVVLLALVCAGGAYGLARETGLADRFGTQARGPGNSVQQRRAAWVLAGRMITASPAALLVGHGPRSYFRDAPRYGGIALAEAAGFSWERDGPRRFANAANPYLESLVSGGLLAFGAFLALLAWALALLHRQAQSKGEGRALLQGAFAWTLGLAVGCQWAVWWLPGSLVCTLLWVILGLARAGEAAEGVQRDASPSLDAPVP